MERIGTFIIYTEDADGQIRAALTYRGLARDGIAQVKQSLRAQGDFFSDVWAVPAAANKMVDA